MMQKLVFTLLLFAFTLPQSFADYRYCTQCNRETRRPGQDVCGSCQSKNDSQARESNQAMMGMGMALIGGMMQAAEKQREAEERAEAKRQAERKLEIERTNTKIMQNTVQLKLIDPSEGMHNLTIQIRAVRTSKKLKYWVGKDKEGAIQLLDLPPKFFEMPAEFNIIRDSIPAMVNIAVYRDTGRNTTGQWVMKNVPLKFFFRDTQEIIVDARLDDEDELKMIIKTKENKSLFSETLAINTPFDYSHEVGVDGHGLSQTSTVLESVPTPPQRKKRRSLRW